MSYRPMLNVKINQIILCQENRDDSLGRTVLICLQFDLILKTKFWKMNIWLTGVY